MTCQYCGATEDVTNRRAYGGGIGYATVVECVNKVACWMRQDRLAKLDILLSLTPRRAPASEASWLTEHRRAS